MWRLQYLRNRPDALDYFLSNADYSYVSRTYATIQRRLTFDKLIKYQLKIFNKD